MSKMYVGSIDLTKIDKSKIVTKDKDGKPFANGAKYYNIVVWVNDEADKYGNIAGIQESMTKAEKDSGAKANYIGNLKAPKVEDKQTEKYPTVGEDGLPF